jgi:hypothetical protein
VTAETIVLRVESEPERELRAVEVLKEVVPVLRGILMREDRDASRAELRKLIGSCEGVLMRRARR